MKFPRVADKDDLQINLAPLIDVIFILLIFFVLTTSFVKENRLSIVLPEAAQSASPTDAIIELLIDADGNYFIGEQKLFSNKRGAIKVALEKAQDANPEGTLHIVADARVPHEQVVKVLDLAGSLNFARVSIATRGLEQE